MDTIAALRQVFDISPDMMVRTVLGLGAGRGTSWGPVALGLMIAFAAFFGRYVFVIVMTHVKFQNPLADLTPGQKILWALVVIPFIAMVAAGPGVARARIEARILEPLGIKDPPSYVLADRGADPSQSVAAAGGDLRLAGGRALCPEVAVRVIDRRARPAEMEADPSVSWTAGYGAEGCEALFIPGDDRPSRRPRARL
jgi:hypothetical protein